MPPSTKRNTDADPPRALGPWQAFRDLPRAKKIYLLLVLSLLGLYLGSGSLPLPTTPSAYRAKPYPLTESGIHIGVAFDYWVTSPRLLQGKVDYIWGSTAPRANGAHHDAYLAFDLDTAKQTRPEHSLSWWRSHHPSWIAYKCDRMTPAYFAGGRTGVYRVPLDFSNPKVIGYQLQQAAARVASGSGYDGISIDDFQYTNFEARCGTCRIAPINQPCPLSDWHSLGYPTVNNTNLKLQEDMNNWIRVFSTHFHRLPTHPLLMVNSDGVYAGITGYPASLRYIDGDFAEAGFTETGTGRTTGIKWQREVAADELLNSLGKAVDLNAYVPAAPLGSAAQRSETNWVLANYLLVKGAHTYTYMQGYPRPPGCIGRCLVDLPEYHVPIGHPTSGRYSAQGVQARNYSGGLTVVNPSPVQAFPITLAAPYHDMYGHVLRSFTMPPASGMVLLTTPHGSG